MPTEIQVHLLPDHFRADTLQGGIAVIVDVLRASTTMLTALRSGAAGILPCLSVEDAREHKRRDSTVLLGGERGGTKIDGFDLSNSPADYDRATVEERMIAFTTTNGTRALLHSVKADQILIGAFVNTSRLARQLLESAQPLHIVCAGTDGEVTGEDALFAGCLTDHILGLAAAPAAIALSDTAAMVRGCWRYESENSSPGAVLKRTRGGRNLMTLSYGRDIETAAAIDSEPVLAAYDRDSGVIQAIDAV